MTREQLIDLFQQSAKNYSSSIYPSALVAEWLDEGQIDIVLRTGCYTDTTSLTSVDGTREYAMGADILKTLLVTYNNLEVQPITLEQAQLFNGYPSEGEGTPTHYYIKQTTSPLIGFTPIPDTSALTISVHYVKRPPTLVTTTNDPVIPEAYQRLIVQHALYNVLWKDTKMETADRWLRQYEQRVARMKGELNGWVKPKWTQIVPMETEHTNKHLSFQQRS